MHIVLTQLSILDTLGLLFADFCVIALSNIRHQKTGARRTRSRRLPHLLYREIPRAAAPVAMVAEEEVEVVAAVAVEGGAGRGLRSSRPRYPFVRRQQSRSSRPVREAE